MIKNKRRPKKIVLWVKAKNFKKNKIQLSLNLPYNNQIYHNNKIVLIQMIHKKLRVKIFQEYKINQSKQQLILVQMIKLKIIQRNN